MNGRSTGYGWDAGSNLVEIVYPGQSVPLTRQFDDAGRLVSVTDWDNRVTGFDYDAHGNWTETVFPTASQNTDRFSFDEADRMVGVEWLRGLTVLGALDYDPRDAKGMVTAVTGTGTAAGTGDRDWGYDARDQLTSDTGDDYGYDPGGNLTSLADGRLQVFDPAQRLCWASPTAGVAPF